MNPEKPIPVVAAQSKWRINGMDCSTEENLIRDKLGASPDVRHLAFDLINRTLTVTHSPDARPTLEAAIRELGLIPEIVTGEESPHQAPAAGHSVRPLVLGGMASVGAELTELLNGPAWLAMGLALVAVATCGLGTYRKGWIAIRNLNLNINALMSLAVTGALLIGEWPEAAMVMFLFSLAEWIEAKSLDRARNAIQGLLQLAPEQAMVLQPDGEYAPVDVRQVPVGTRVRVRPGERIALDGVLVEGASAVNQAPITGESLPVDKKVGDAVFAGTINESGSFDLQVTAAFANTTLARIIHAVEEAQASQAPTQRFVDRFARVYTPVILALAVGIALFPPWWMGGGWREWFYRALVLLVIACPCALVISTPITIVSGLAAAARRGILVKGGVYLEDGRRLGWLALDKTGTLTHGKPVQTDFESRGPLGAEAARQIAVSLAARSDHPVSRAVTQAGERDGVEKLAVSDFTALPGRGIRGVVEGVAYHLGNHRLIEELKVCSPALEARLDVLERQGKTTLLLTDGTSAQALFAVADTVRETSRAAIQELEALGVRTVMLTGDNPHTASAIAAELGIGEAHGNLLPEDKARIVASKRGTGARLGMVGDGINDAPALAQADIGFAMGAAGTGTAIETADVALMDDDLRKIAQFVRMSRATHSILLQNISLALGIKAVFLVLTLFGIGTLWMAVFADMGTSLLVVANGLRMLRWRRVD